MSMSTAKFLSMFMSKFILHVHFHVHFHVLVPVITVCNHGPRISAEFVTLSCGLFLTCRGEKYRQYYTVINGVDYLTGRVSNAKNLLLRELAFRERVRTSFTLFPCQESTAPFPTSHWPHPHLLNPPLQALKPTHGIQFELAEDNISTSEIFLF
jgi:hypothetical protein